MSSRLFLLLFAIASALRAAEPAANVATLATAYANPSLGPAAFANKMRIRVSNMTFDLTTGRVAPVLVGGKNAGIFFSGDGHYSYHSTDPIETPLVLFEAKKLGRAAQKGADGTVTVEGTFEHLFLCTAAIELPALAGESVSAELQQTFKEHRDHFAKARWRRAASHLFIQQQLDDPAAQLAVAEMGGQEDNAYVFDGVEEREERLLAMITDSSLNSIPELRGAMRPIDIAQQPVGRNRVTFLQPLVLLADIDYTLVAGDKESAKLTITETLVPRRAAKSALRLDLVSGMFDTDGNYRRLRLDGVVDGDGKPLPYSFERDSVVIGLPAKVPAGTPMTVRFEISGNFLIHPNNDNFWQLGTEPWFPQPGLNGQYYTVHSVVKVKKPWLAFAPGNTVARREEGDFNVVENKVEKPVQFTVAHAGKYALAEETFDGLTIRVATYAAKNERAMQQLARLSSKIIKFYEPFLGPFPFKELNIIEINDLGWGQAPPGTMFITKEAFNPLISEETRAYSSGVNQRFAHEIAHQYWGHVVKMGSSEEQWLNEAFAEYCSSLVVKEIEGQRGYDALLQHWRSRAKDATAIAPIPLANRIFIPKDPYETQKDRVGLIYSKGAYVLAALRQQAGDKNFFLLLRNLQGRYAWRFVTTKDVADLMQRIDGKEYQAFFDRYFWGTEMPPL